MKEITKAKFINTWASEWDERTGWKVSEEYHKQFSEQLEYLIDQEVEKRIAERMLTDEDIIDFALLYVSHKSLKPANRGLIKDAIIIGMKQLRSRLTNPGAESSQKTEGGGE